jgi:hypothetical protein
MQNASILYLEVADFSENYFEIKPSNAKKFLLLHALLGKGLIKAFSFFRVFFLKYH